MYWTDDESAYHAYGATVVGWGGAHTLERVARARRLGLHATGTMWCLTANPKALHANADLRDAVVRDVEGQPVIVPWLRDHVFEGTPSWWGCTNHPAFRAHVRRTVCDAMAGGADGLHVDDHLGTASAVLIAGGCFCRFCVSKFGAYLARTAGPDAARRVGLRSPRAFRGFDYAAFVRVRAPTHATYLERRASLPLYREFVEFQVGEAARNVSDLHRLAREIAERPVTLSANTCLPWPPHMAVVPRLTYMVGEVGQHAAAGLVRSSEAVVAYRLADALGKPMAATAAGSDWACVQAQGRVHLVRYWIAQAYACGQRFMAPHRMWCHTAEMGTHWYDGPTEAYAPLYRFVRANARWFDGYTPAGAPTAVLFDPRAACFGRGCTRALLEALAAANLPFTIRIPRGTWGRTRGWKQDEFAGCSVVLAADTADEPLDLDAQDRSILDRAVADGAVLRRWPVPSPGATDDAVRTMIGEVRRPWRTDPPDLWVFPRCRAGAPSVIHLLNRAYEPSADAFAPRRDVTLDVAADVVPAPAGRVTVLQPDAEPHVANASWEGEHLRVRIPTVNLWALLVVE
jgi:hypothetical protein